MKLLESDSEYYQEALDRFKSLVEGRDLIAYINSRKGPILHLRFDLMDPAVDQDPTACINAELVRDVLATVVRKGW